jgi:hypothetical protein
LWAAWCTSAAGTGRRRSLSRNRLSGQKGLKVVSCNGVLVLLSQESLFHEDVEIRWQRPRASTSLEEPDGAGVLLASEDELFLFLALSHLFPRGHGDCQHDAHDAQGDEQRHHGVPVFDLTPQAQRCTRSRVGSSAASSPKALTS